MATEKLSGAEMGGTALSRDSSTHVALRGHAGAGVEEGNKVGRMGMDMERGVAGYIEMLSTVQGGSPANAKIRRRISSNIHIPLLPSWSTSGAIWGTSPWVLASSNILSVPHTVSPAA